MDLAKINEKLNRYLRPQSYPVALRMCGSGEELPPKTKIPGENLDLSLSVCHAIAMTRRYGWTVSVDHAQTCWVAALSLGFAPLKPDVADGTLQSDLGLASLCGGGGISMACAIEMIWNRILRNGEVKNGG